MHIAIVDDNKNDIHAICRILDSYRAEYSDAFDIDVYYSGEEFLDSGFADHYQLILMDIYMEELDGIETARQILLKNEDTLIAFLTVSEQDIWRAVETHGCFDYIQKDQLCVERLANLMQSVNARLHLEAQTLTFQSKTKTVSIPTHHIQYAVSQNKHTVFTLKSGEELSLRLTFSTLHNMLENHPNFLLCNRGVLLNMDYILNLHADSFEMADKTSFPIRRKGRRTIIETFQNYQFQKLNVLEEWE